MPTPYVDETGERGGGGQLENIASIFNYFILFKILIFYNMGQAPFSSKEMPSKIIANCYEFCYNLKIENKLHASAA